MAEHMSGSFNFRLNRLFGRKRNDFAAREFLSLARVIQDRLQVMVKFRSMLVSDPTHFFDNFILPHNIPLLTILPGCRSLAIEILPYYKPYGLTLASPRLRYVSNSMLIFTDETSVSYIIKNSHLS